MKGDPRFAAKCPLCPHVVRPRPKRKEKGYVPTSTSAAVLRNAMRQHFMGAHPGLSIRRVNQLLRDISVAAATVQTQLLETEQPAATAFMPCPVPECHIVMHTWLDPETGNLGYAATHALRQHLNHAHPDLTLREKSLLLDGAEFRVIVENGAGPGRPPQGPGAGGPALPDLVAPSRPGEQAHASGKVGVHTVSSVNKSCDTVVVQQ